MKTLLAATALGLSMTAAAGAAEMPTGSDILAGGPLFAETEETLYCEFTNFGSASITPTAQQIFLSSSTTAIASASSCANGTAIAPNQTCVLYPSNILTSGYAYACKLTFSTATKNVRGSFQLYDNSYNVLSSVELR